MRGMLKPITRPEISPEMRMPEPVVLSQFRRKTAASLVGLATTGGMRRDSLSIPVTGNCGAVILLGGVLQLAIEVNTFSGVSMMRLPVGVPQQKTMALRMIQGTQARATWPAV